METTNDLQELLKLIIWSYMAIFILLSSMIKKIFGDWLTKVTKSKWKVGYTVFVIATILGLVHIFILKTSWEKVLLTYSLGTSLYDLLLCHIEDFFTKKLG